MDRQRAMPPNGDDGSVNRCGIPKPKEKEIERALRRVKKDISADLTLTIKIRGRTLRDYVASAEFDSGSLSQLVCRDLVTGMAAGFEGTAEHHNSVLYEAVLDRLD